MGIGGGFGALDTFNKTLKKNRELLKKIKIFEKIKPYNKGLEGAKLKEFGESTPEQIEHYRQKAREDSRKHSARKVFLILVFLAILYLVMNALISLLVNSLNGS